MKMVGAAKKIAGATDGGGEVKIGGSWGCS